MNKRQVEKIFDRIWFSMVAEVEENSHITERNWINREHSYKEVKKVFQLRKGKRND